MGGRVGDADTGRSGALHDLQQIECATDAADFAVVPGPSIFTIGLTRWPAPRLRTWV